MVRHCLSIFLSLAIAISTLACGEDASPTEPFVKTASIVVVGAPCGLSADHYTSCFFRAVPARQDLVQSYMYTWRFTNPVSGRAIVTSTGNQVTPSLNCFLLPDAGTATIQVNVTATVSGDIWETGTTTAQITRPPGQC